MKFHYLFLLTPLIIYSQDRITELEFKVGVTPGLNGIRYTTKDKDADGFSHSGFNVNPEYGFNIQLTVNRSVLINDMSGFLIGGGIFYRTHHGNTTDLNDASSNVTTNYTRFDISAQGLSGTFGYLLRINKLIRTRAKIGLDLGRGETSIHGFQTKDTIGFYHSGNASLDMTINLNKNVFLGSEIGYLTAGASTGATTIGSTQTVNGESIIRGIFFNALIGYSF